ncbi:MAG: hypothetical protein HY537_06435 [Deltaproteobacteria bacterium]|nr:hypothetical protein [Deltaproteobacteria bacterium]
MDSAKPNGSLIDKASERLIKIVDHMKAAEGVLRDRVEKKRKGLLEKGISEADVSKQLVRGYVHAALIRSTGAGVVTALPWNLPIVGAIPTFLLAVGAHSLYVFKNELELCYLVAFSSGSTLNGEALKHRAFWLVGLSDYQEVKKRAKKLGVRIALKKLVEKLAVSSASRGLGHFFICGFAESMGITLDKRIGFFVGAPIGGFYGYRSTLGVAERATEYFQSK